MVTNERTRKVTTTSPTGSVTTREVPEVSNKERVMAGTLLAKIDADIRGSVNQGERDGTTALPANLDTMTDDELYAYVANKRKS
jgi:hypothetical protein